jgi:hypothetical protein
MSCQRSYRVRAMGKLSCILLLVAAVAYAASVQPSQFRHQAGIEDGFTPDAPARVTLTEGVISKTSRAFSDLRLFDDKGLETPYVIYEEIVPGERETTFQFKVRSFDTDGDQVVVILERPENEKAYDRIDISTPARDFKKNVEVYTSSGSGDGLPGEWQMLASDTVFDFTSRIDLRKTRFQVGSTSSRYLKLVLTSEKAAGEEGQSIRLEYDGLQFEVGGMNREPFRIDRVSGWRGERRAGEPVMDRKVIIRPRHDVDDKGNSLYSLGPVNLPLSQVTLKVDRKYYHRNVQLLGADTDNDEDYIQTGSGTVYNIPGMDEPSASFSVAARHYRYMKLKVVNRDNPPLDIQQLELAWPRTNLFFLPEKDRSYTLFFGGDKISKPDYELGQIIKKEHEQLASYPVLSLEGTRKNSGYKASEPVKTTREATETAAFKIIVGLLVLGLGWWLYSLMKKLPAASGRD